MRGKPLRSRSTHQPSAVPLIFNNAFKGRGPTSAESEARMDWNHQQRVQLSPPILISSSCIKQNGPIFTLSTHFYVFAYTAFYLLTF